MFNFKNLFNPFKKSSSRRKKERYSASPQQAAELERLTTNIKRQTEELDAQNEHGQNHHATGHPGQHLMDAVFAYQPQDEQGDLDEPGITRMGKEGGEWLELVIRIV